MTYISSSCAKLIVNFKNIRHARALPLLITCPTKNLLKETLANGEIPEWAVILSRMENGPGRTATDVPA